MTYPVTEIFRSLQGEGHFVGYPMVFVRLAGCSVTSCHIRQECDEAPWKARRRSTAKMIVDEVKTMQPRGIVCVTGGEPTDHALVPLVGALRDAGFQVHLETSGVRAIEGMPIDWLTVSPKVIKEDGLKQRTGHVLKLVVRPEWSSDKTWDVIHFVDRDTNFFHRYLQPMTGVDGRATNMGQVIDVLMDKRNDGGRWALSFQAHRIWDVK